ncbi:pilus assembly protein Flp/PilA [Bosea sp. BE125]|uniref:Flp family type IVb pilin n=1 Tax=Bosea sp. BE125 TaxID=2817909 RepID=UPI002857CF6E|nr:Flp family type IVb pilin [Bosea sp. BE125]MDR6871254.1 pilus assembly protein Flp/PilA [Bosea sp. BE125]
MAISDFASDARGATAIEYGLVVSLISLTIVVWATQIGQSVLGFFQRAAAGLSP